MKGQLRSFRLKVLSLPNDKQIKGLKSKEQGWLSGLCWDQIVLHEVYICIT